MAKKIVDNGTRLLEERTEDLPVGLTLTELCDRGEQLAAAHARLDAHEEHESQVKSDLKATKAKHEAEIKRLAGVVRQKKEPRPVAVEVRADFQKKVVMEYRLDTGEVILERSLTKEERDSQQLQIPGT